MFWKYLNLSINQSLFHITEYFSLQINDFQNCGGVQITTEGGWKRCTKLKTGIMYENSSCRNSNYYQGITISLHIKKNRLDGNILFLIFLEET